MMRPFRFAIQTGPFDDPVRLRDHAQMIEELGYDELWSSDHIGGVDPFLPLTVAAEATTTLRFGPLVLNNEFHNPVLLARAAATFDVLSGGRLVLGMGTGYMRAEHDASGIALREPGPRVTRLAESLEVLRTLLDEGAASFAGTELRVEVEDLGVRPAQAHVPILVGGHGRRVVRVACKFADVVQFTGLTHEAVTGAPRAGGFDLDDIGRRAEWVDGSTRSDEIERSALVQRTHVGPDGPAVTAEVAARVELGVEVVARSPFVLIGSLEEVADKLRRQRVELGISHVVVRDPEGFAPVVAALAGS